MQKRFVYLHLRLSLGVTDKSCQNPMHLNVISVKKTYCICQKRIFYFFRSQVETQIGRRNRKFGKLLLTSSNFYEDDKNSRLIPGKKDSIPVKKLNCTREQVQKRLSLCHLLELYAKFVSQHETIMKNIKERMLRNKPAPVKLSV